MQAVIRCSHQVRAIALLLALACLAGGVVYPQEEAVVRERPAYRVYQAPVVVYAPAGRWH